MKIRSCLQAATALPLVLSLGACGGSEPHAKTASTAQTVPAPASASSTPDSAVSKEPAAPTAAKAVVTWTGLSTPESVLFDEANDRYLVSNINGKPLDKDNNGFISVLGPDGKVVSASFIQGGAKVKLDAPKGMAIAKGVLYVADIDRVRMFDPKTGAAQGEVVVKGAAFLNDVAATADGRVFVTDSGLKQGEKDFEGTGTDAVYEIQGNKATARATGKELGRPNGLFFLNEGGKVRLLANTFGDDRVYEVAPPCLAGGADAKTASAAKPAPCVVSETHVGKGALDGLATDGQFFYVSSWEASAVFRGKLAAPGESKPWERVVDGVKGPADIAIDTKRGRVLVPRFFDNIVEAYELPR